MLQKIAFSFDYFAKRLLEFQECFGDNDTSSVQFIHTYIFIYVIFRKLGMK